MPFNAVLFSRRAVGAVAVALALAVGLAACGSSSSSTGTNASASAGTTSSAQFQARLNLAKCFRSHGVNVPDPSSGGGVAGGGGGVFRALRSYPQAKIQAATQACQQYFSKAFTRPNLTPAQRQQAQQQLIKFAQCMRSHGVNVPDPTTGRGPGGGFGFGQFRSIDRNSPAFQAAATACASLRPRFGRGGPGGAGGPAPSGGTSGA
jgi:hypothetical protein